MSLEPDISSLDAVAIRLLETSNVDMWDDRSLLEQKHYDDSARKDSLGCDLFVDHFVSQDWGVEEHNSNPTTGIVSSIFDVEADDSWPCLNRIPSPDLPELGEIFRDLSWGKVLQDVHPRTGCGILPSCSSSSPSARDSPIGSP